MKHLDIYPSNYPNRHKLVFIIFCILPFIGVLAYAAVGYYLVTHGAFDFTNGVNFIFFLFIGLIIIAILMVLLMIKIIRVQLRKSKRIKEYFDSPSLTYEGIITSIHPSSERIGIDKRKELLKITFDDLTSYYLEKPFLKEADSFFKVGNKIKVTVKINLIFSADTIEM